MPNRNSARSKAKKPGRVQITPGDKPNKPGGKQNKPRVKAAARIVDPGKVLELRRRLQLTQAEFARLLPVSVRSLATLEKGGAPTEVVARRVIELGRLVNALSEVIRRDSLGAWLQTPNKAFDGLKSIEVIDRGESDRLWSMIYFLRSGAAS